ncbi:MAG: hypothetical protein RLZZ597_1733 [Cyanobacteriota bacterium]|jgi:hypothetical protein
MKPGSPSKRGSFYAQRGALEPPASDAPSLEHLSAQAEQLEERLHRLKTGITNLLHLQRLSAEASGHDPNDAATDPTPATADLATAQAEVRRLQQSVDEFELTLASHLLSWRQLQEPFWQAVRYGGLGLVGGWVLHWLVRG